VIGWERKWSTVNREFCEDGEVVRWRAVGHGEGGCSENTSKITRNVVTYIAKCSILL